MCSLLQPVSEKVSPASTCPYLKVSLCGSGSGHVMEDKCARVNCSVLQIPFPMSLLIKKKGRPAVAHGPSEAVEWRWGLHRSLKAKGKKMTCHVMIMKQSVVGSILIQVLSLGWVNSHERKLFWLSESPAFNLRARALQRAQYLRLKWMSRAIWRVGNESNVSEQAARAVLFCSPFH